MNYITDNSRTKRSVSAKREAPEVYERRQDSVLAFIGLGIMCNSCAFYALFDVMPQKVAFALFNFGAWPAAFAIYRTWRRWKEQDTEHGEHGKNSAESFDEERMVEF